MRCESAPACILATPLTAPDFIIWYLRCLTIPLTRLWRATAPRLPWLFKPTTHYPLLIMGGAFPPGLNMTIKTIPSEALRKLS